MPDEDLAGFSELRQRAEERAQNADPSHLSLETAQQLIHELQVHQIELEIQNEELRRAQLELQNSQLKYRDLYEFSPVGLLTLDDSEKIVEVNTTLEEMLGVSRDELLQTFFSAVIHPASQDTYHFFFQDLKNGITPHQCEVTLREDDQREIFVRLDGIAMPFDGTQMTYRVAVSNLTAQRQAEQKSRALLQEQQRMKVLAEFMRVTSHDLRTPITIIMTGLYLIGRTEDKAIRLKKIAEIEEQLFLLTHALEQLQQMAVLNSMDTLDLKRDSIPRIMTQVLETLQHPLSDKNIQVTVNVPEILPPCNLDAIMLYQALLNLVTNSLQWTPSGGLISITASQEGQSIIIQISDNGIGIEADMLPHIFDHFFKADGARNTRTGGVGLGLPMAKRIIELHHGAIAVQSTPHVNTTFRVSLPIALEG